MGAKENEVAKTLLKLCKRHGVFAEKVHNEGETGCPDYILSWPAGQVSRVETKSKDGRVSPKQDWYHRELGKRKQVVFVPKTPADVELWFARREAAHWCSP